MGDDQGPGQCVFCDRAQNDTKDQRGGRKSVLLHKIAYYAEDQGDEHIVSAVVKGKGTQKAKGEDDREEHGRRNLQYLGEDSYAHDTQKEYQYIGQKKPGKDGRYDFGTLLE